MNDTDLGRRLREARKRAGLTQGELAQAVGLDQSAISRVENGAPATSSVLARIADAVGEPLWALFRPVENLAHAFRASAGVTPATRRGLDSLDQLLDDLGFLRELQALSSGRSGPHNVVEPRTPGRPADFALARERAAHCRGRLGLEPDAPVGDIVQALESLGLNVVLQPLGDEAADGIYVRRADVAVVLLNSDQYPARLTWSGAHELGHDEMGVAGVVVDETTYGGKEPPEQEADAFAAEFLVPSAALRKLEDRCDTPEEVATLAREYGVSYPAMVYRLHNSQLIRASHRDWLLERKPTDFDRGFDTAIVRGGLRLPHALQAGARRAYVNRDISLARLADMLHRDRSRLREDLLWEGILHAEDADVPAAPGAQPA